MVHGGSLIQTEVASLYLQISSISRRLLMFNLNHEKFLKKRSQRLSQLQIFQTSENWRNPILIQVKIAILTLYGLSFIPTSANALSLSPLNLESAYGQLRIVNTSDRLRKIKMTVYSAKITDKESSIIRPALNKARMKDEAEISPSVVRVSGNSARFVNYSIRNSKKNYYLCAETLASAQYRLRVCALWFGGK